jgi:hypothetical protein
MPATVWGALGCLVVTALLTGELFVEDCLVALLFPVLSIGRFLFTSNICSAPPFFYNKKSVLK